MTALEQYQPRAEMALANTQDVAIQRLGEWARSAEAAHHIAQTLVQTSFCPEQFRNKPGEATAAILAGLEVGLQPMAALRSFDIIQGTAAARAVSLRAMVQSHGHEMVLVESTEARCKMKGRRKGTTEWSNVTWTIDRAKKLGVTNKPNWRNQPQTMLVARATSELARLIASDAILGIPYSIEELDDGDLSAPGGDVATAPTTSAGTRRMSRRKPAQDEPDAPVEEKSDEPQRDEHGQRAAMFATFNDATALGIVDDDRDARIAYCAKVADREIESSNDLTWDEVSAVIDSLKGDMAALEQPFPADLDNEPGGES